MPSSVWPTLCYQIAAPKSKAKPKRGGRWLSCSGVQRMHELTESVKTKKLFGLPVFLAFFLKKKNKSFFFKLTCNFIFLI